MMRFTQGLFDLSAYQEHRTDMLRAALLYTLSFGSFFVLLLVAFLLPEDGTFRIFNLIADGELLSEWWVIVLLLALGIAYFFVRVGQLVLGAWTVVSIGLFAIFFANLGSGLSTPIDFVGLCILMLLATVLLRPRSAIFIISLAIGIYVLLSFFIAPGDDLTRFSAFLGLGSLFVFAFMMATIHRMIALARVEGSSEADQERLKLAELNSFVTRKTAERTPLQTMLNDILSLLLDSYPDFYHAQVFLLDEPGLRAQLVASTGSAGQKLLGENHGLAVGSRSIIGQVTLQAVPMIEEAGTASGFHRPNPALPLTRMEAAFPLRTNDRVIGALDLQSQRALSLEENDIQIYQSVADSLSLAIDNYRQIELAQKRAEDNRKLVGQTQNALREVERLNQRLIGSAWADYLQTSDIMQGFDVDLDTENITTATSWTSTLADAVTVNTIIQDGNTIAMPLRIRGHVIGAIEFELPAERELTPESLELVREISDRFGLAAENTRLLEESLKAAQRESLINEISRRLQSASNVETTLTEAARSLHTALDANQVAIRLGKPDASANNSSNGKG